MSIKNALATLCLGLLMATCGSSDSAKREEFAGKYTMNFKPSEKTMGELNNAKSDISKEISASKETIKEEMANAKEEIEKAKKEFASNFKDENALDEATDKMGEGMSELADGLAKMGEGLSEGLGNLAPDLIESVMSNLKLDVEFAKDGTIKTNGTKLSVLNISTDLDNARWSIEGDKLLIKTDTEKNNMSLDMKKNADGSWLLSNEEIQFELTPKK